MSTTSTEGVSIGVLAARTGVTPAVLRTWENRYGFPAGQRTATGHRRFGDDDVERVRRVVAAREAGVPLSQAIESVLRRTTRRGRSSVHAALGARFPELRPHRMSRRSLVALSHAVEDEALARADRPLVLGAFQEGHRYDRSRPRWDELGRTASWAAVVADFGDDADASARPARCQLPEDSELRREWTVVALGHDHAAVVSAWEVPAPTGGRPVYESVVSTHRPAVVEAARVLTEVATDAGAVLPAEAAELLEAPGLPTPATDADRLWWRAMTLLDSGAGVEADR